MINRRFAVSRLVSACLCAIPIQVAAQVVVESRLADNQPFNNEMKLDFRIWNPTSQDLLLTGSSLEYDFTDTTALDQFASDVWWFSQGSTQQVSLNVSGSATDAKVLQIAFQTGTVLAGGYAEVQMRLYKKDWTDFDETDDPSFLNTAYFASNTAVRFVNGTFLSSSSQTSSSSVSSSSAASSSSGIITVPVLSGKYGILAADSLRFSDRLATSLGPVSTKGLVASGGKAEVGADALVKGGMDVVGDLFLRERATIEGLVRYSGSLSMQNGIVVGEGPFLTSLSVTVPQAPSRTAGTQDVAYGPDQGSVALSPGVYGGLNVGARNTLTLSAGEYVFSSFWTEPDVVLVIDNRNGPVSVYVTNAVRFGDRNSMQFMGDTNAIDFQLFVSGSSTLDFGTDGSYYGRFVAPLSSIRVPSRVNLRGWLVGSYVNVEPDTKLCTPPLLEDLVHSEGAYGPEFDPFNGRYIARIPQEVAEVLVTPYIPAGTTVLVNGVSASNKVYVNSSGTTQALITIGDAASELFLNGCGSTHYTLALEPTADYMVRANASSSCNGAACDGASWATGFKDIESAYESARTQGKELWVAQSNYLVPQAGLRLTSGAEIYGGFSASDGETKVSRSGSPLQTILDGDLQSNDPVSPDNSTGLLNDNATHVLVVNGHQVVVDGISVQHGAAVGTGEQGNGGGLYLQGGSLFFSKGRIKSNGASIGGGIYSKGRLELSQVELSSNVAWSGNGGGVFLVDSLLQLNQTVIHGNTASAKGGGVYFAGSLLNIYASLFDANSADIGGALYVNEGQLDARNATVVSNQGGTGAGGIVAASAVSGSVSNSILASNTNGNVAASSLVFTSSLSPSALAGSNNVTGSPQFYDGNDADGKDGLFGTLDDGYRIVYGTTGSEAGSASIASASDLLGLSWDGKPSMGAYKPFVPPSGEVFGRFNDAGDFVSVPGGLSIITGTPPSEVVPLFALSEYYRIVQVGVDKHDETNVGSFVAYLVAYDAAGHVIAGAQEVGVRLYKVGEKDGKYLFRSVTSKIGSAGYAGKPVLFTDNPALQGEFNEAYVIYAPSNFSTVGYRVPRSQF